MAADEEALGVISVHPLLQYPVVKTVMRYLSDEQDMKSVRLVCTEWNKVMNESFPIQSNMVRIREDGSDGSGESTMADFVELLSKSNSIKFIEFNLSGFNLGDLSTYIPFATKFLGNAKLVQFEDAFWNYDGFNEILYMLPRIEELRIFTKVHVPMTDFVRPMFNIHLPALRRITLKDTCNYNYQHLVYLLETCPWVVELNGLKHVDTQIICKALRDLGSPTTGMGATVRKIGLTFDSNEFLSNAQLQLVSDVANLHLPITDLTIGKGMENEIIPSFYQDLFVSMSDTLVVLEINGMEWWTNDHILPIFPYLQTLTLYKVRGAHDHMLEHICPRLLTLRLVTADILITRDFDEDVRHPQLTTYEYDDMDGVHPRVECLVQFRHIAVFVSNVTNFFGKLRDEEIRILCSEVMGLKVLTLDSESSVSDAGIIGWNPEESPDDSDREPAIMDLPYLAEFNILVPHACEITDLSIWHGFTKCRSLETLELPETKVSSEGVLQLVSDVGTLRRINIDNCLGVDEDGVKNMRRIKQSLRIVH